MYIWDVLENRTRKMSTKNSLISMEDLGGVTTGT